MAGTTLGALTVHLAADTAGFQTDMGRAARIAQQKSNEIKNTIASIGSTFAGLAGGLSVGIGAGMFASWIKGALDAQDKADELGQKLGLNATQMSKLSVQAKFSATDLEGVSKSVIKLAQNQAAAVAGSKAQIAAFDAIGVSVTNANGTLKSSDILLGEIADKMSGYRDSAEKTTLAIALFGKTGSDMIPMLNEGSAALDDWAKMAEQFGLTVSTSTGKAAAEFADNIDKILFAGKGVANTIAAELAPALAQFSREIVNYLRSDDWKAWLDTIRGGARVVADHFQEIAGGIKLIGEVAVIYIGGKLVESLVLATWHVGALTMASIVSATRAGGMAAAWTAAGGNIAATTAASVKEIGAIPLAVGAVTAALAGWQIGTYLRDQFIEARLFGIALVEQLLVGWERIKQGAELMWAGVKFAFNASKEAIMVGIADIVLSYAGALEKLPTSFGEGIAADLRAYAASLMPAKDATQQFGEEVDRINASSAQAAANIRKEMGALADSEIAAQAAADAKKQQADATAAAGAAALATAPNVKDLAAADAEGAKNAKELADAQQKMADILGNLRGAADPMKKIWSESAKSIREVSLVAGVLIERGEDEAAVQDLVREALELLTAERNKAIAALEKQRDVTGNFLKTIGEERELIGLTERQRRITLALREQTKEFERIVGPIKANDAAYRQLTATVTAQVGALYDQQQAYEASVAHTQRYADIVRGAFDSMIDATAEWAVNGFKNSRDFWKGMVDTAKRAIAQLLAEWAKTKIIGWFTGASSGGGGFWGTLLAGAAAAFGGKGDTSSQAPGGFLAQYGANAAGNAATGGGATGGTGPVANAAWGYFGQFASSGAGSATAAAAPYLGAILGGYYGSTRGDGGVGTAIGVTAGVIAGYYAATVAASAISYAGAAYAATAGAGAATTAAATAGGAAAGASAGVAAIPIIGWVAAIVLAIDAISGGKALGTKYRPHTLQTDVSFGADGPQADAYLTEWKYRRNIFQFNRGGSLEAMRRFGERQYRGREIDIDPELMAALQKVADDLDKTADKAAQFLQTETIAALDASFQTLQVFDKKGRLKRTETVGTILGKEYRESWEKFQVRMHAETIIATVSQLDMMASKIAEAYRGNADTLIDAAAVMMQAQHDITAGNQLLGTGRGLESTMAWLEKQRTGDETLVETYGRLAQATAQYNDILKRADEAMQQLARTSSPVDQMKQALAEIEKNYKANVDALNAAAVAAGLTAAAEKDLAKLRELTAAQINKISTDFFAGIDAQIAELMKSNTPAGDFAAQMRAIHRAMLDNIAMANLVARAAGLQGASEQQLARIHELAARQATAAIAQLQSVARQQARSLGYLGPQSVAEIDARIAELQGRADSAAQAVQGFGAAMTSAAQEASNAIDLLLGNLSPLNDQAKLQIALQGLYAGTVSQDQVLEIGRRLYASSQRYVDLFWQVMSVRPRSAGGGSGGSRGGGNEAKPLTLEEQAELLALRQRRELQVKQERYLEANEFANTVASIAAAQGLSFEDVAKQIGFDLKDLAKDLGMSQEDLIKYLSGIDVNQETLTDSLTSNFDRLIERIDFYWGGDDETPPPAQAAEPGRAINLPMDPLRGELAAGREEASRERRDVIAAMNRNTDAVERLVEVTIEGNDREEPRNVRDGWGVGVPRR